jgi:hypothetical protein
MRQLAESRKEMPAIFTSAQIEIARKRAETLIAAQGMVRASAAACRPAQRSLDRQIASHFDTTDILLAGFTESLWSRVTDSR